MTDAPETVGRYAIVSDVHGNSDALVRAFALLDPDDVLLCLGDVVGYGPNPNECVSMISGRAAHAVLGNHDLAALNNFGVEYFNEPAREAIAWTQGVLTEQSRAWLDTLPYELRFPEFLLVHGAPVNYFEYIFDKAGAAEAFERTDAPLIFIGHTHVAEYWSLDEGGEIGHRHMQSGGELMLEKGKRYIVDVGSVGQPRDLNPAASMVFYEPAAGRVRWRRFTYDIPDVQRRIHDVHLPDYLATRLESGR